MSSQKRSRTERQDPSPKKKRKLPSNREENKSSILIPYTNWEDQLHESWRLALEAWLSRDRLKAIHSWVSEEYESSSCCPPANEIFTAFQLTPFDQVKVVMVGQDPYPGPTEAMGLSFSVHRGVKVPGSLRNIYKCLETDPKIDFKPPNHGDLTYWATQGVFMLNAVLTVKQGEPNSHAKRGWEDFTDEVVRMLNAKRNGLVFMLWGTFAQNKARSVNRNKHCVLEACHPSPLSAVKGGFYTCGHFSMANEYLIQQGVQPIDWSL